MALRTVSRLALDMLDMEALSAIWKLCHMNDIHVSYTGEEFFHNKDPDRGHIVIVIINYALENV